MHYDKHNVSRNFTGLYYAKRHNNLREDSVVSFQAVATGVLQTTGPLACYIAWINKSVLTFQKNVLPPSGR